MEDGQTEVTEETEAGEVFTVSPAMRRSLPITLLRAREAVMSHFRPMLAQHDVTEQQWRVIRVLHEAGMHQRSPNAHSFSPQPGAHDPLA